MSRLPRQSWVRFWVIAPSLIASSLFLTPPASADVSPPVDLRLELDDPNAVPVSGDLLRATLSLSSPESLVVTAVDVQSGRNSQGTLYWQPQWIDLPADLLLEPGRSETIAVELLANTPSEPFVLKVAVGGVTMSQSFYVIPPSDRSTTTLPAGVTVLGLPAGLESEAMGADPPVDLWLVPGAYAPVGSPPARDASDIAVADLDGARAKAPGLIRILGSLVVHRSGFPLAVDGATVQVYDQDATSPDDLLGTGVTLADGSFDFQVFGGLEAAPDVYLRFLAGNQMINVQYGFALSNVHSFDTTWSQSTATKVNTTASTLNFGTQAVTGPLGAAFYNHSLLTKMWRYLSGLGYVGQLTRVRVAFPGGDWSTYNPNTKTINLFIDHIWDEPVILHEFGHHWMSHYAASPSPNYCNPGGFQDPPGEDCGHNVWCSENSNVAWSEGFPNFLADMTNDWIESNYHSLINQRPTEFVQQCGESSSLANPLLTENFLAAAARDFADNVNEADPSFIGMGVDQITDGVSTVLATASSAFQPSTALDFVKLHVGLNLGPTNAHSYWRTAQNSGYEIDESAPGTPLNFTSTSHAVGVPSSDATVTLTWDMPPDDMSGVRRYILEVAPTPVNPGGLNEILTTATTYTTAPLSPGTHYITIEAVDFSNKVSLNYATFGPIVIEAPTPTDLTIQGGRTWPLGLVPRDAADATITSAPMPTFISGDQAQTWFNFRVVNLGQTPTSTSFSNWLELDGVQLQSLSVPASTPIIGGGSLAFVNLGPFTVRGGRHTAMAYTDAGGFIAEPDEANNRFEQQFVWVPSILVTQPADRAAPPDPYGGMFDPPLLVSRNCDGLSYLETGSVFSGLAVVPVDPEEDPDLRSYDHTTGPLDGFEIFGTLAMSNRPAGAVDAVFSNTALHTGFVIDVGIYQGMPMSSGFRAFPLNSTTLPVNADNSVDFAAGEFIALYDVLIPNNFGTDHATLQVSVPPSSPSLWAAIVPPSTADFGLDDATVVGQTLRDGLLTLEFTFQQPVQGIVLYRDRPSDGSDPAAQPVTLRIGPTPPNFLAAEGLAGWSAPVAPTAGAPGTASNVPMPVSLSGGTATTYLNLAASNDGPNPGVPLEYFTRIDDIGGPGAQTSGIVAGGTHTKNFATPITVPGGRHMLWASLDPGDLVGESNEADNLWGKQWVWTPPTLNPGLATSLAAPSDPLGGIDAFVASQQSQFYFNVLGLRDAAPIPSGDDGHWRAVVAMPADSSDVDLRLHDAMSGVSSGFADVRVSSNAGMGELDYVLTNFRALPAQPMDVGVLKVAGNDSLFAQTVASTFLDTNPTGEYGDFTLGNRELLALHEVYFDVGSWAVDVIPTAGTVDWGITLHRANLPYQSRQVSGFGMGWSGAPAGGGETITADVFAPGYYCVAVWKATSADVTQIGQYRLRFSQTATANPPDAVAARSGIRSILPNPFNPRTVIRFESKNEGLVRLRIYDLRGALVRTLADETLVGGAHERVWDGVDDQGRRVASGVYFVRLSAAGEQDVRKAVLLK